MTQRNHEIFDPDCDELLEESTYQLFGVRNCDYEVFRIPERDEIGFRIGMLLPGRKKTNHQVLVEIFCRTQSSEPKFEIDWKTLQHCYLKNAIFTGKSNYRGFTVYNFQIASEDVEERFIWLECTDQYTDEEEDLQNEEGIIARSSGSVFGSKITEEEKILRMNDRFANRSLRKRQLLIDHLEEQAEVPFQQVLMIDGQLGHPMICKPQKMHL